MPNWTPDPSFYPSPRMAMKAAPETLAYVAAFDPNGKTPDAIAVVDVDPKSSTYSQIVGSTVMPNAGDELHHFGWNACSSCLCPNAPHAHAERRYLVTAGKLVTFTIGLRFLTDYLEGDEYFRIHREHHNLERCRRQFRLLRSIAAQEAELEQMVDRL